MLKKLVLVISCLSLLALVACNETPGISHSTESETAPTEIEVTTNMDDMTIFDFSIEIADEEMLENLADNHYIEINYADARDGFVTEGLTLIFNFSHQVSDFSLIEINMTENGRFVKTGILAEIGNLDPDVPLILTHYHTQGTFPRSGFYFLDPNGNEQWFTLHQSPMDGSIEWQLFPWSHDYGFYDMDAVIELEDEVEYVHHEVQQGETLFSISQLYGTTVESLQQLNALGTSIEIRAGQLLKLPPGSVPDSTLLVDANGETDEVEIEITAVLVDDISTLQMDLTIVDYSNGRLNENEGRHILLQTENVLNELQVVALYFGEEGIEVSFIRHELGDFDPIAARHTFLLLRSHYEIGTSVQTGLVFIDESGTKRTFMISICQVYGKDVFITEVEIEN